MSRAATGFMASTLYKNRICYCGGGCFNGSSAGEWGLSLMDEVSTSYWHTGFRL